jgi:hypothetical protein
MYARYVKPPIKPPRECLLGWVIEVYGEDPCEDIEGEFLSVLLVAFSASHGFRLAARNQQQLLMERAALQHCQPLHPEHTEKTGRLY